MKTPRSFANFSSIVLTVLVLLASPAASLAAEKPAPSKKEAAPSKKEATPSKKEATPSAKPAAEQAAPAKAESPAEEVPPIATPEEPTPEEPAPATPTPETAAAAEPTETETETAATPAAEPGPEPASVTQVGIERLRGSAYPTPQTRGIKYGSLALTFHGLQWPYMPAGGAGSRFVLGLSGWGWVDTSYEKFAPWGDNPKIDQSRIKYWIQQARLVLRATPTYSLGNGWFIQGQAEFVATEDQTIDRSKTGGADTDDLWLRIGQWNKWDFMIGRYEGWEIFHLGMGLDLNTFERIGAYGQGDQYNPEFYGVTDNHYRPQGAAGNLAFHYYPLPYLRFELLSTLGSVSAYPTYAARPVAIFDIGWLKLKAGAEYQKGVGQQVDDRVRETRKGVGGAIQFVLEPHVEFGLNAAQGTIWNIKTDGSLDQTGSKTRTSYGGFLNVWNGSLKHPLTFGLGSVYTKYEDQFLKNNKVDEYWQLQNFVAVQYVALQQLYIKLVGGYARGHWDDAHLYVYDDEMYSVRLRVAFYF